MLLRHEDIFKLSANDFYQNGNIKLNAVLNLFQTVASDHAEKIGLGFKPMLEKDIIWVLIKIRLDIVGEIPFSSTVKVVTYPHPKGRLGYVRDYLIYNEKDELVVKGSSLWCLVSFSSRKLLRPTIDYEGQFVDNKVYLDDFARLTPVMAQNHEYVCHILQTHIDRNNHTNNIKYADFIIDGLTKIPNVKSFSIQFNNETTLGDEIKIGYEFKDNVINATATSCDKNSFNAQITT